MTFYQLGWFSSIFLRHGWLIFHPEALNVHELGKGQAIWMSGWFLMYIHSLDIFFQISGPLLPMPLAKHSMVRLDKGQAILGGYSYGVYQAKIYSMTCSNKNCIISLLDRELSVPKFQFVAIPIPDTISGCITGGKKYFQ